MNNQKFKVGDMVEFKVLRGYGDKRDLPSTIPFGILNEDNAIRFHSQTLSRLNERGGLTPEEIYCNATGALYHTVKFDHDKVLIWLNKQVSNFNHPIK